MRLRILIIVCFILSALKAYPQQSCLKLLSADHSYEVINLPSELKIKDRASEVLIESGHSELLKTLASVFEALRDPILLDIIRSTFRVYNTKYMTPTAEELESFLNYWAQAPEILIANAEKDKVKSAYFALSRNLESTHLTEKEIFYTASLLTQSNLRIKYRNNSSIELDAEGILPAERSDKRLVGFLQTLDTRRQWSEIVNDPVFKRFFLDFIEIEGVLAKSIPKSIKVFNEIKSSKKIKIENNRKSRLRMRVFIGYGISIALHKMFKMIDSNPDEKYENAINQIRDYNKVNLLDQEIFDPTEDYDHTLEKLKILESHKVNLRVFLLDGLESALSLYKIEQKVTASYIDFMDEYIFDVKQRFTAYETLDSLVMSAKKILLPLKTNTYKALTAQTLVKEKDEESRHKTEDTIKPQDLTKENIKIVYNTNWYPNKRKDSFKTKKNPKKRKNIKATVSDALENKPSLDKKEENSFTASENTNTTPLILNTGLKAGVKYSFNFSRHPEMPEQTITFDEDTVEELQKHTKRQNAFIQPLLNGFTGENGRNGIRDLTTKKKHKDKYEIKPSDYPFRILIQRKGTHWETLVFSHKNKVPFHIKRF
jgi:hypothetical protein